MKSDVPMYDPYIPRSNPIFFNCSFLDCDPIEFQSLTQLSSPKLNLKSCFLQSSSYECETIRYNYFKNVDKVLFLWNNVRKKIFYLVNCLVYTDGVRVCHKKDDVDSYTKLVDTGTIARPNEPNILLQDEFICEEGHDKDVNCDLNPYVLYSDGLKLKAIIKSDGKVILKTGTYVVILERNCIDLWCGYSGSVPLTRRNYKYNSPGGKTYRCYYAKKQQICKEVSNVYYNKRE